MEDSEWHEDRCSRWNRLGLGRDLMAGDHRAGTEDRNTCRWNSRWRRNRNESQGVINNRTEQVPRRKAEAKTGHRPGSVHSQAMRHRNIRQKRSQAQAGVTSRQAEFRGRV